MSLLKLAERWVEVKSRRAYLPTESFGLMWDTARVLSEDLHVEPVTESSSTFG
jgi:hypothetical protein